ncbi:hypothetical protein GLOIN_2v1643545 [Rhizophagus clarus]|uniref:Uncharacterized protein n=2 Tax=Rhizophagus clarus TaxID=94130 RepID=A0A8H3M8C6_9GLOM|nr:hypothetical protein GLOIN_2v1643545 [Rhizophagus clarus]
MTETKPNNTQYYLDLFTNLTSGLDKKFCHENFSTIIKKSMNKEQKKHYDDLVDATDDYFYNKSKQEYMPGDMAGICVYILSELCQPKGSSSALEEHAAPQQTTSTSQEAQNGKGEEYYTPIIQQKDEEIQVLQTELEKMKRITIPSKYPQGINKKKIKNSADKVIRPITISNDAIPRDINSEEMKDVYETTTKEILFHDIPVKWSDNDVISALSQIGIVRKCTIRRLHKYASVKANITLTKEAGKLFKQKTFNITTTLNGTSFYLRWYPANWKTHQIKQRNSWQMTKDWDHIIKKEEMDGIIKEIVTRYGAAFVKPVVINKKQKMIAFFKNEDTLLKAIGKSVAKDFLGQWTMRVQDDRFTTNIGKKDKKKEKPRKKKKKETVQNGKRKEKSIETIENEERDTPRNEEAMDFSSSYEEVSSLTQPTRSSKTNDFDYTLANEVQTSFASRLKSVNAEKGPLKRRSTEEPEQAPPMKEGASTRDSDDYEQYLDAQEDLERSTTPENPPSVSSSSLGQLRRNLETPIDFDAMYKRIALKEQERRKNKQ